MAKQKAEPFLTLIAKAQSAGRGRLTRSFFSPPEGLYFSTTLLPAFPLADYGLITPFAAVAVFRAVQRVLGITLQIKWVNDLLLDGRKVAGILAESGTDADGIPFVILGIGINTGSAAFPKELQEIAASIPCADRERLFLAIMEELGDFEAQIKSGAWLREFRANLAFVGKEVFFSDGNTEQRAVCLGVTENAALRLLCRDGIAREYTFGEISLKSAR